MKKLTITIILLLTFSGFAFAETSFPAGWRSPTIEETPDLHGYRSENPERYLEVSADFNGDGNVDTAKFLVNDLKQTIGVFVFMSSAQSAKQFQIFESDSINHIRTLGIALVDPGTYKTACGKGYWDCTAEEKEEIHLVNPAINFFNFGSANAFYYWDEDSESFKITWISD